MKRGRRRRWAGWRMPEGARYVGRPTLLGNPWTGVDAFRCYRRFLLHALRGHGFDRSDPRELTDAWIWQGASVRLVFPDPIERWPEVAACVRRLRDVRPDVYCWCALDVECHADVIIEVCEGRYFG